MEFSNIRLDLRPPIAQVTLDRPKVLNALNAATLAELAAGSAFGTPGGFFCYHSILGDIDSAADWYEKAIEQRDPRAPWLFPLQFGDFLTSTPRWPGLMRMMNLKAD
jgi:hypothetical protein